MIWFSWLRGWDWEAVRSTMVEKYEYKGRRYPIQTSFIEIPLLRIGEIQTRLIEFKARLVDSNRELVVAGWPTPPGEYFFQVDINVLAAGQDKTQPQNYLIGELLQVDMSHKILGERFATITSLEWEHSSHLVMLGAKTCQVELQITVPEAIEVEQPFLNGKVSLTDKPATLICQYQVRWMPLDEKESSYPSPQTFLIDTQYQFDLSAGIKKAKYRQ